jgi:Rrf2 family protein
MKLITRDTDYGIRALCAIAKRKKAVVAVSELVKTLGVPRPFLRKILQALNKEGVLKSFKGQGGGFRLAVEPGKIYLTDLMRIFQGGLKLNECSLNKNICPNVRTCPLRKKICGIERYVIKELQGVTVASLLK